MRDVWIAFVSTLPRAQAHDLGFEGNPVALEFQPASSGESPAVLFSFCLNLEHK